MQIEWVGQGSEPLCSDSQAHALNYHVKLPFHFQYHMAPDPAAAEAAPRPRLAIRGSPFKQVQTNIPVLRRGPEAPALRK